MFKMKVLIIVVVSLAMTGAEFDACSSGLCKCTQYMANCLDLNLTYIPPFPQEIQTIQFRDNYLPRINATTFTNISGLYLLHLYLPFNHIQIIDSDSFTSLSPLRNLDLSGNIFNTSSLRHLFRILNSTKVRKLTLRYIGLKHFPDDILEGFSSFPVREFDFSRNRMQTFNFSVFKPIPQLQRLDLYMNQISYLTLDVHPHLEYLSVSNNYLRDVPDLCGTIHYFPQLRYLELHNNSIVDFNPKTLNCLKQLNQLDMSRNGLGIVKTDQFRDFRSLAVLHLSCQRNSKSPLTIEESAFNNKNLKTIYLNKNILVPTRIHKGAFNGCTGLTKLDLSENFFNTVDNLNAAISPLTSLTELLLYKSGLQSMPSAIGERFHRLMYLEMGCNKIKNWPDNFFINHTRLSNLTLNDNAIETVKPAMFPPTFQSTLQNIDMSNNPILCECDNVWFVYWMLQDRQKFVGFPKHYKCLDLSAKACLKNTGAFISVTVVVSICVLLMLLVSFIYKYRWDLKYQIYIWRHRPKQLVDIAERHFEYDAFVSYCEQDSDWVLDRLVPNVEGGNYANLKLCLHQRDFDAGRTIIDNIVEHMQASRKILVILSNEFTRSEWCQFEITLAQKMCLDMSVESIIVVLLENIDSENMSKALHALLKTTTYLTWDNGDHEELFWERLRSSAMRRLE